MFLRSKDRISISEGLEVDFQHDCERHRTEYRMSGFWFPNVPCVVLAQVPSSAADRWRLGWSATGRKCQWLNWNGVKTRSSPVHWWDWSNRLNKQNFGTPKLRLHIEGSLWRQKKKWNCWLCMFVATYIALHSSIWSRPTFLSLNYSYWYSSLCV